MNADPSPATDYSIGGSICSPPLTAEALAVGAGKRGFTNSRTYAPPPPVSLNYDWLNPADAIIAKELSDVFRETSFQVDPLYTIIGQYATEYRPRHAAAWLLSKEEQAASKTIIATLGTASAFTDCSVVFDVQNEQTKIEFLQGSMRHMITEYIRAGPHVICLRYWNYRTLAYPLRADSVSYCIDSKLFADQKQPRDGSAPSDYIWTELPPSRALFWVVDEQCTAPPFPHMETVREKAKRANLRMVNRRAAEQLVPMADMVMMIEPTPNTTTAVSTPPPDHPICQRCKGRLYGSGTNSIWCANSKNLRSGIRCHVWSK